jgi:hypothetical protein
MSAAEVPAIAPWGKWDKASLQAIFGAGALYGLLVLVVSAVGVISELVTGERLLTLPVSQPLPSAADSGPAVLSDGHFETATALVSNLSAGTSALLTTGSIVGALSNLLVIAAFLYLVWRLLRREPFQRSLTWIFVTAGAVLMFGSIIGQAISGIGTVQAMSELGSTVDADSFWPVAFTFDGAPLGLGLVLLLVGAAFEYAQKLSTETRGLV